MVLLIVEWMLFGGGRTVGRKTIELPLG